MNEEVITQQEQTVAAEFTPTEEEFSTQPVSEYAPDMNAQLGELKAALREAKIKLALLLGGAAKEKLNEGERLAEGFCNMGLAPEEAAVKVMKEYPHLKLVAREIPTFATQNSGGGDGFAAIRSVFAKR